MGQWNPGGEVEVPSGALSIDSAWLRRKMQCSCPPPVSVRVVHLPVSVTRAYRILDFSRRNNNWHIFVKNILRSHHSFIMVLYSSRIYNTTLSLLLLSESHWPGSVIPVRVPYINQINLFKTNSYSKIILGGTYSVMVIVVENGFGDPCSNSGRNCLHITGLYPWERLESSYFSPAWRK